MDTEEPVKVEGGDRWMSMEEACEFLQISEQTLFRWMRAGKVTYYKVGKSSRFKSEDLEVLIEKVTGAVDADVKRGCCPVCGNSRLIEGTAQSTGGIYFKPKKAKFWVFTESMVATRAQCCSACGNVQLFADLDKLQKLTPADMEADKE